MPAGKSWSEYNEQLVRRGEIFLSLEFIDSWNEELASMNDNKRGRPYKFPESMILFLAVVYHAMRVPYRALEGILRSLNKYIPALRVADYSTIAKRIVKMKLPLEWLEDDDNDTIAISIDSSGIKVTNRGDWIRKKWRVYRGWIKVHIAVDATKGKEGRRKVLAVSVTEEKVTDAAVFKQLFDMARANVKSPNRIKRVYLDGAYDRKEIFNMLDEAKVEPVIRVRKDASTKARGSPKRAEVVRAIKKLGYGEWKKQTGYGYRWAVEGAFSAVKRMFGEVVRAHKPRQMAREAIFLFLLYNRVISG